MKPCLKVLALAVLLALFSSLVFGQAEQGTIAGIVKDSMGAVVADAKVIVKNTATNAVRNSTTNSAGQYTVPDLTPSNYEIVISKPGFQTYKVRTEVTVGGHLAIDAELKVGSEVETVEVVANAVAAVNTETQELQQLIDVQQVATLPSLTRNVYDFVNLAGNVSNGDSTTATTQGGGGQELTNRGVGFNINGQRQTGTEILLDGAENVAIFGYTVGNNIPIDGVQEYSIITNNFSPEFGRAAGGVVNVTTKVGTNNWHGSAWEFNRLSAYTANTFNNVAQDLPKGTYTRNVFGFQGGGPLIKNKLFISESTEWTRVRSNSIQTAEIFDPSFISLLPANAQAYFNSFGSTTLKSAGVASTWGQWLTAGTGGTCYFTTPAGACFTPLVNNTTAIPLSQPVLDTVNYAVPFNAGGGVPQNNYTLEGRLDYTLSDKTQMFFRAAREHADFFQGSDVYSAYPQYDLGTLNVNQSYLYSINHQFSSTLVDSTKLSFTRYDDGTTYNSAYQNVPLLMFVAPYDAVTGQLINMPGLSNQSAPGLGGLPATGPQNTTQFMHDVSWSKGGHNMKFGGQFTYIQMNYSYGAYGQAVEELGGSGQASMEDLVNAGGNPLGSILSGSSGFAARVAANALPCPVNAWGEFIGTTASGTNNCPTSSIVTPPLSSPSFGRSYRYNDWALYAQDSYRLRPRLTVNYGLRWEHYGVQHNNNQSLDSNFYFGSGSGLFEQVADGQVYQTQKSPVGGFWKPSWGTLAPRVGFAYDVFGDSKTSLRGGFGISYERNFGNVTYNASFNPPASAVIQSSCTTMSSDCPTVVTNANLGNLGLPTTPASPLPPVELRFLDPSIHTAQTQFWSLDVQRQVARSTIVDVGYSGAHGVHLYDLNNVNNVGMAQHFMGAPLITTPDPVTGAPCPYVNMATQAAECLTRPNQQYTNINERGSGGTSSYNAFNFRFQTQNLHNTGLNLVANYTWAHSIDDESSTFSDSIQGGSGLGYGSLGYTSVVDPKLDWGASDFDVRQRLVVSPIWDLPWYKSQRGLGEALGGWSLVGMFTARTGVPFNMYDLTNEEFYYNMPRLTPATPISNYRVSSNPGPILGSSGAPLPNQYGLYTMPIPASSAPLDSALGISDYGPFPANMTGRNAFRGPGAWSFDSAVNKNFRLTERFGLVFRAEGFNIFNHHNMYTNTTSLYYSGPPYSPFEVPGMKGGLGSFAMGGNNDERRFGQFSLRFTF
jgi:outer membrane receptor protein involved in Fe transport